MSKGTDTMTAAEFQAILRDDKPTTKMYRSAIERCVTLKQSSKTGLSLIAASNATCTIY